MNLLVFFYLCKEHADQASKRYGLEEGYFLEKEREQLCDVYDCRKVAYVMDALEFNLDKNRW
jgi:hypothetical protein